MNIEEIKRNIEEIRELCKNGKLYDVEKEIRNKLGEYQNKIVYIKN